MPYPIPENSGLYIEILSLLNLKMPIFFSRNITLCT